MDGDATLHVDLFVMPSTRVLDDLVRVHRSLWNAEDRKISIEAILESRC